MLRPVHACLQPSNTGYCFKQTFNCVYFFSSDKFLGDLGAYEQQGQEIVSRPRGLWMSDFFLSHLGMPEMPETSFSLTCFSFVVLLCDSDTLFTGY